MELTADLRSKATSRWAAIAVLLATLLGGGVRLAYVYWLPGQKVDMLHSDMGAYDRAGRAMAHSEAIVGDMGFNGYHPLSASAYYHVGYTWFVAAIYWLFGDSQARLALRVVQGLLSTTTIPLVYAVGKRVFDEPAGAIAACLTAAYLPFVYYSGLLLTETVFIFLQMVGLWLILSVLERGGWLSVASAGLVAGLACAVRTLFLPALVFWAFGLLLGNAKSPLRSRLMLTTVFVVFALVPIVPITIRNLQIHGRFILLSTNGPATFYTGHVTKMPADTDSRPNETDAENAARLRQLNVAYLRYHSRDYLMEIPEYYSNVWLSSEFWPAHTVIWTEMPVDDTRRKHRTKLVVNEPFGPPFGRIDQVPDALRYCDQVLWLLIALPAALVAPLFLSRRSRTWVMLYGTLVPYLIVPWIAPPFARYRIPACPLVFVLSGVSIATICQLIRMRPTKTTLNDSGPG